MSIVRGDATPEEIAAVILALTRRTTPPKAPTRRKTDLWRDPTHRMRKPLAHGLGAWRSGSLPF
ncbi:acyl-CoA carboxylase subunit epsilon [Spongiactinospora sp. TRM90649]|uniref:acyl-CoA carboxylase subunit epsilon n=1 Tax=Spongiactinospora sp. TRM90649 TaxID=3031114 RepID=UPI0023F8CE97|nr:acyl-CoA carboxylase subunit epsilon [Spongiactinospora sp. TRM90649]MDF5751255.1 acyl-CoA carboxylase subunit epsilon [Spongiactinospora sp. TRM90649]